MNKTKKAILSIGSIAAAAVPIATAISCAGDSSSVSLPKYVDYTGSTDITKAQVGFVTDGGKIDDKSFNQSVFEGATEGAGGTVGSGDVSSYKPKQSSEILASYENAKSESKKLIVAAGFNHATAMNEFATENPDIAFVAIDFDIKAAKTASPADMMSIDKKDTFTYAYSHQGNVATAFFNMKQASFLEGVLAAKEAGENGTKHSIGAYGGMKIPPVVAYIEGFKKGVEFYNANNASSTNVKFNLGGYVGNFDVGGQSKTIATKLVSENDLVMAVGGPQYQDVLGAINAAENSTTKLIGVDTNISDQVGADDKTHVFGSILKNLKAVTKKLTSDIMKTGDTRTAALGHIYMADIANSGIGITQTLQDNTAIGSKKWSDVKTAAEKL